MPFPSSVWPGAVLKAKRESASVNNGHFLAGEQGMRGGWPPDCGSLVVVVGGSTLSVQLAVVVSPLSASQTSLPSDAALRGSAHTAVDVYEVAALPLPGLSEECDDHHAGVRRVPGSCSDVGQLRIASPPSLRPGHYAAESFPPLETLPSRNPRSASHCGSPEPFQCCACARAAGQGDGPREP
ncbi:hypothetical protein AAFF_G00416920 [Aldrovandia affinis]|uniref:Uncharacterized protein n=1 Tax=Aldrovandia affinis TaxID=143900 RepID=A0AAD7SAM7_9TELE|nr:hypothetical protein AAFF_G00416920 [Aldrovandia affinis]